MQSIYQKKNITSIGAGLIDLVFSSNFNFLNKIKIKNGDMSLVNINIFNSTLSKFSKNPIIIPGGSSCNTSIAISKLKKKSQFICKIGNDFLGTFFENNLIKNNVVSFAVKNKLPTGRVISIVTPDAQRTMLTYLGASSKISSKNLPLICLENSKILHIEGYLIFNIILIKKVLTNAKRNSYISIDLSSQSIVENNLKEFRKIICTYTDIILANEKEIEEYSKLKKKIKILNNLPHQARIVVIKIGDKGSITKYNNNTSLIPSLKTKKMIDTTGAGDTWSAGFFSGLSNNLSIEKSAKIASICSTNVCKIIGTKLPIQYWNRINEIIKKSKI